MARDRRSRFNEERFSLVDPADVVPRNPRKWKNIAKSARDLADETYAVRRSAMSSAAKGAADMSKAALTLVEGEMESNANLLLEGKASPGQFFNDKNLTEQFAKDHEISVEEARKAFKYAKNKLFTGVDRRALGVKAMKMQSEALNPDEAFLWVVHKPIKDAKGNVYQKPSAIFSMTRKVGGKHIKKALGQDYDKLKRDVYENMLERWIDSISAKTIRGEKTHSIEFVFKSLNTLHGKGEITGEQLSKLTLKAQTNMLKTVKMMNDTVTQSSLQQFRLRHKFPSNLTPSDAKKDSVLTANNYIAGTEKKILHGTALPSHVLFNVAGLKKSHGGLANNEFEMLRRKVEKWQDYAVVNIIQDPAIGGNHLRKIKTFNTSTNYSPEQRLFAEQTVAAYQRSLPPGKRAPTYEAAVDQTLHAINNNAEIVPPSSAPGSYNKLVKIVKRNEDLPDGIKSGEIMEAVVNPAKAKKLREKLANFRDDYRNVRHLLNDEEVELAQALQDVGLLDAPVQQKPPSDPNRTGIINSFFNLFK